MASYPTEAWLGRIAILGEEVYPPFGSLSHEDRSRFIKTRSFTRLALADCAIRWSDDFRGDGSAVPFEDYARAASLYLNSDTRASTLVRDSYGELDRLVYFSMHTMYEQAWDACKGEYNLTGRVEALYAPYGPILEAALGVSLLAFRRITLVLSEVRPGTSTFTLARLCEACDSSGLPVTREECSAYLDHFAITYADYKKHASPNMDPSGRYGFRSLRRYPIILTTAGSYTIPVREAFKRATTDGLLYALLDSFQGRKARGQFLTEFGAPLSEYVGRLLDHAMPPVEKCDETFAHLPKRANEPKHADFIVEGPSATIVVECKRFAFTQHMLTRDFDPAAINARVGRIAEAFAQIERTFRALEDRDIATQDMIGLLVVYGKFPAANSILMWEEYRRQGTEWQVQAPENIIVLDLDEFEVLMANDSALVEEILRHIVGTPLRDADVAIQRGDMSTYLSREPFGDRVRRENPFLLDLVERARLDFIPQNA
jgi:hypothetical protein